MAPEIPQLGSPAAALFWQSPAAGPWQIWPGCGPATVRTRLMGQPRVTGLSQSDVPATFLEKSPEGLTASTPARRLVSDLSARIASVRSVFSLQVLNPGSASGRSVHARMSGSPIRLITVEPTYFGRGSNILTTTGRGSFLVGKPAARDAAGRAWIRLVLDPAQVGNVHG